MAETNSKRSPVPFILGGVLLIGGFFGFREVSYLMHNEDTDNSQLEQNIVPVAPKIAGYIEQLRVKENQLVRKGDTLVVIDDRDLKLRVEQAEIALRNAQSNVELIAANAKSAGANVQISDAGIQSYNAAVESSSASVGTAQANADAAKVNVWKATQDLTRYTQLLSDKAVTQQQFDNARAAKESADAQLQAAQRQVEVAQRAVQVARSQTNVGGRQKDATQSQFNAAGRQVAFARTAVDQRKADLELAKLNLSYAAVTAPVTGFVSRKSVQIGQLVNAGQPLFSIVDQSEVWITANFKETQTGKMKVGDKVKIKLDAYPGKEFDGEIQSFAGATGSKFTLLPPDNASGNFVKVVQRIPVRIIVDNKQDPNFPLRAGMSADVVVPHS